ncbi:MAG: hypothetical protein JOZ54_12355 [Acidobacteria bacterium]|nr:hypothetical protein [Acidobacteriota bacterium]
MANVTRRFMADPVGFLRTIPCSCPAQFIGLRTLRLKIEYDPDDLPVAQIRTPNHGEDGTQFHLLGWMNEDVSTGYLNSGANYFFTGPLTGCTFAVDKNWYEPHVLHVNYTHHGAMDVGAMRATANWEMYEDTSILRWTDTPNITVVESHNRPEDERYNIFGVRGYLGWTFYQQVTRIVGNGNLQVRALYKLDTAF